jgi:hypothetical protein
LAPVVTKTPQFLQLARVSEKLSIVPIIVLSSAGNDKEGNQVIELGSKNFL